MFLTIQFNKIFSSRKYHNFEKNEPKFINTNLKRVFFNYSYLSILKILIRMPKKDSKFQAFNFKNKKNKLRF